MEKIKVKNLSKRFGKVTVLKNVNLEIKKGEITAILGPNAAGKTTLLKCILGLVIPTEGEVYVDGKSIRESEEYKAKVGYMPQEPSFPQNLTPKDVISLVGKLKGKKTGEYYEYLVKLFKLSEHMEKPIGNLSGGTKQKVNALVALSFNPDILILDEPTVGLDPVASTKMKMEIMRMKSNGKTIVLTSHIMSEVEALADRVVLLIDGVIRINSTVEEIKRKTKSKNLEEAVAKILEEGM
ncbi:hypothetical protein JCM9492_03120 [Aquifex pyrophilus]